MNSKTPIILLAGLLACSLQAYSAVVTISASAPASNVIKSNPLTATTPANVTSYWRAPGATDSRKGIGQGFSLVGETTDYSLQAVTFNIQNFSPAVQGLSFNISIYKAAAVTTVPGVSNLIASEDGIMASGLTADGYIKFTLDSAIVLEKGYFYNVMFSWNERTSDTTTVQSISFKTAGTGTPITAGGRRWIDVDGTISASGTNGFIFYAEGIAIPEPGTGLLLLTAAGISLVALRKRLHR